MPKQLALQDAPLQSMFDILDGVTPKDKVIGTTNVFKP